jgi:hypothetical protein
MKFDEWFSTQPLSVSQNTRYLMHVAYCAGLKSAAKIADRERQINSGEDVACRSGEQSATFIAARVRDCIDKEHDL